MKEYNLVHLASILNETMCNAGYMDDLDELVADRLGSSTIDEVYEWAIAVDESISFVNDLLGTNIKVNAVAEVNQQLNEEIHGHG